MMTRYRSAEWSNGARVCCEDGGSEVEQVGLSKLSTIILHQNIEHAGLN